MNKMIQPATRNLILVTHVNPDVDALVALFITMKEERYDNVKFFFKSAYNPVIPNAVYLDMTPKEFKQEDNITIVDHHYGKNNSRVTAEIVWRKFGSRPEYKILVEEAGIQDRCQDRKRLGIRFRDVFIATKSSMIDDGTYNDREFAYSIFQLFNNIVHKEKKLLASVDEAKEINVQYVTEGNYSIAYYEGRATPYVSQYLFGREGVSFIVYKDGNNIGISRNAEIERPDLNDIKSYINKLASEDERDSWFYHPSGFLACRGSKKNPAGEPSSIELNALVSTLAMFLRNVK